MVSRLIEPLDWLIRKKWSVRSLCPLYSSLNLFILIHSKLQLKKKLKRRPFKVSLRWKLTTLTWKSWLSLRRCSKKQTLTTQSNSTKSKWVISLREAVSTEKSLSPDIDTHLCDRTGTALWKHWWSIWSFKWEWTLSAGWLSWERARQLRTLVPFRKVQTFWNASCSASTCKTRSLCCVSMTSTWRRLRLRMSRHSMVITWAVALAVFVERRARQSLQLRIRHELELWWRRQKFTSLGALITFSAQEMRSALLSWVAHPVRCTRNWGLSANASLRGCDLFYKHTWQARLTYGGERSHS